MSVWILVIQVGQRGEHVGFRGSQALTYVTSVEYRGAEDGGDRKRAHGESEFLSRSDVT